jgi:hypothetical protein
MIAPSRPTPGDDALDGDGLDPGYHRAGGDCVCPACGKKFYDHPYTGHRDHSGHRWLKRLCDGRLVKL